MDGRKEGGGKEGGGREGGKGGREGVKFAIIL